MTYAEMCKFIFYKDGFTNWEQIKNVKSSKKNIVQAKYLCMYFGTIFFAHLSLDTLSDFFGMAHAMAGYARKTIINDCLTDPGLKRKVDEYYTEIRHLQNVSHGYDEFMAGYREERLNDATKDILEKMNVIVDIYCKITGKRLV